MTLLNGWLRGHGADCVAFTGWVGDTFWYEGMVLDPVPGYPREATLSDIRGCGA